MNPTRKITEGGVKGMVLLLALALASCAPASATHPSTESPQATKPQVLAAYGKLPLSFEANQGQTEPQVKFLSRGSGYTLFLTSTEAVLMLTKTDAHAKHRIPGEARLVEPEKGAGTVLRMKLLGANPAPAVAGVGELPGKSNYFVGNDPKKWRTNVSTYAKVDYREVYPGVNLVYYGNQRQLEHDFVVSPGADPKVITLAFEGVDGVAIDALGDLVLRTVGGEVRLRKPVVYQEQNRQRAVIPTRYVLTAEHQVAFEVAAYDATKPLIIDPVLVYSTYLGGSGSDASSGIAVDTQGNAYVTGVTRSSDFPTTTGAFQIASSGGEDAFVTKLNPTGSALVYSTFLGGSNDDEGFGIAADAAGNAYVTGVTTSSNFPTTAGAVQSTLGGFGRAFVTKLNPTGTALVYSTYLGGTSADDGFGIAADAAGNAYVTGFTQSSNFPTRAGAFQATFGGVEDTFVTKLDPTGAALVYSTYLGGSGDDDGFGIATDAAGNAYVTGFTDSTNFPTTADAFQTNFGGVEDAFVTKLNPTGAALVYSTYLGGSGDDEGLWIAVDAAGNAYVTGGTDSINFPTTTGAFQIASSGGGDGFVSKFTFGNTSAGANVTVPLGVPPGQVTVTLATVTAAGDTTLTTSDKGPSPPTPAGFKLGNPPTYYDLATTASFTGPVTVCINYTGVTFQNEAGLKLFHFEDTNNDSVADTWEDRTVSLDPTKKTI